MKKLFFGLLLIGSVTVNVYAQGTLKDANGVPMRIGKYVEVDGDPFLSSDWRKGIVVLENGVSIKNVNLKLDVVDSKLLFQNDNGEALIFTDPVKEFSLTYPGSIDNTKEFVRHFKNGYTSVDNISKEAFFEVLYSGTVELLKRTFKTINEQRRYDSSITSKSFQENVKYYLVVDGKATPVKSDKKSFLSVLKDKQTALEAYIKSKKVNFKNDADLSALIAYYNSI